MTHTLQAIGWTLIHFCWQAAAVAAAYGLVSLGVARRSSHTRYMVALCALLAIVACSLGTLAWEFRAGMQPAAFSNYDSFFGNAVAVPEHATAMSVAPLQDNRAAAKLSLAGLLPWIDGAWVVGVLILSLRSMGGWWLIHVLRTSGVAEVPAAVQASFKRICAALGLRRPVALRISGSISGPMTVGALRALVLLPLAAAANLSTDEMEVVLAHELAHVRRADFAWNLLQTLAETLFFFHPAVWWVSSRIRQERELCCDDVALTVCPNPVVYAHALLRLEEQRSRQWQMAMALDGHQPLRSLHMRIARILGEPTNNARPARPFSLSAACAAMVLTLFMVPQLVAGLKPAPHAIASPLIGISAPRIQAEPQAGPATHTIVAAVPLSQTAARVDVSEPAPQPAPEAEAPQPQQQESEPTEHHADYIDRMKAAGYDVDLDKYIAMKTMGVTPEYARAMAQVGFGKPSADDLIACRTQGVTPEAITQMKQQGLEVKSLQDAISLKIFSITPEYAAGMKAAGFDNLDSKQLLAMRVQGVTPEYARTIRQQYPGATVDDVVKTRIFRIDADFIAQAKKHAFNNLSLDKLVQLRISGLLDDESVKP